MKKISIFLSIMMVLLLAVGCQTTPAPTAEPTVDATTTPSPTATPQASEEPTTEPEAQGATIRIAALKGPTGLGMLGLMDTEFIGGSANTYEFTIAGAPEEIVGKISSGEVDIAAVPVNLVSTLYNKTSGGIKIAAVNTLGVIYMLERGDSIQSIADLSGKTIYSTGQGATPEFSLNYLLAANGITDTTVEYKSEHSELATLLLSGEVDMAVLPEPFVTTVLSKADDIRIALDFTAEWASATAAQGAPGEMVTGGLIVSAKFLEENPDAFASFMADYALSVDAVNGDPAAAGALAVEFELMADAALAEKAIPSCNIVCVTGQAMKDSVSGALGVYFEANPQSVGGALPDDAFYYMP